MPKVVPEYKEEAKSRILEAANKVFAEKGYHEATMDDIAKRLGVSKGAIYLYFSSKEDLFEALCKTAPQAFKEILYSSFGNEVNPIQSATEFLSGISWTSVLSQIPSSLSGTGSRLSSSRDCLLTRRGVHGWRLSKRSS